jgi:hypothetical protein
LASSIAVSKPNPLELPEITAIFFSMVCNECKELYNTVQVACDSTRWQEMLMRALRHFRAGHQPYVHAHPMHMIFSVMAGTVLAVIIVLMLVDAAK